MEYVIIASKIVAIFFILYKSIEFVSSLAHFMAAAVKTGKASISVDISAISALTFAIAILAFL